MIAFPPPRLSCWLFLFSALAASDPAVGNTSAAASSEPASGQVGEPSEDVRLAIEVDAWAVSARNLDLDYAFLGASGDATGGTLQTLGYDRETIPRYQLHWRLGRPGAPLIRVVAWDFESAGFGFTAGDEPRQVGAPLATPDFRVGRSLVDSAEARQRIAARAFDVSLAWRPRLGRSQRATLELHGGFRSIRFEESGSVLYTVDSPSLLERERLVRSLDSRGIGPLVGAGFSLDLGSRARVFSRFDLAFPIGETDSSQRATAERTNKQTQATSTSAAIAERDGEQRMFTNLGGAIGFEVDLGAGCTIVAAFEVQSWTDIRRLVRFTDVVSANTSVAEDSDATFEGASLGLRYQF